MEMDFDMISKRMGSIKSVVIRQKFLLFYPDIIKIFALHFQKIMNENKSLLNFMHME